MVVMHSTDRGELREYRDRAREWLEQAELPELPLEHERRFAMLRDWQRTLFDAGWVGIHWPREFGGQGLTMRHTLVFAEELVRARAPHPVGLIGLEVVGPTILRWGTDAQRRRLLPPLLSGEELWCQGFSEPNAGSDLASLRTTARRDGDELVINGQKVWTSWGTDAQWCAVLARTELDAPRHKSISYLLVDMRSPGIEVRPIVQMTGDAEFNEVFFDNVHVRTSQVLGALGDGWKLAMDTLGHERGGYALRRRMENEMAFVDLVLALRSHYASEQRQPDPWVVRTTGELFVKLKAFEAHGTATVQRILDGDVPSALDSVDKLTLSETEQELYATAVQLLGPCRTVSDATNRGLHVERWMKGLLYARSGSVYGGSSQIQRTIVAERMLGLPRGNRR